MKYYSILLLISVVLGIWLNGICRGVKMYIISVLRLAHCF